MWPIIMVFALKKVYSKPRPIRLIVSSLAQSPKRFCKEAVVILPVKDFKVKSSYRCFPEITFRLEQVKITSAELPSRMCDFLAKHCSLLFPV